jgi:hypothetical protein
MTLVVFTQTMNIIRNIILDMAGGMMHTDTLNFLTWLVALILFVVFGVVSVSLMALIKDDQKPTGEPVMIDGAQ